jgi:N-dimethylarginine dimethylaminohydrolase
MPLGRNVTLEATQKDFHRRHKPSTQYQRPTFLMCSPEWYEIRCVLNPWMAGNVNRSTRDTAFAQWKGLYTALLTLGDVRLLRSYPEVPDMTFVAHSAILNCGVAIVSRFDHSQRTAEEGHLLRWLEEAGFLTWQSPHLFEGEGDAVFDLSGNHLWIAHGSRTSRESHRHLGIAWHIKTTSLHLIDPRFYHLDTCFAPLSGGHILYFPEAFDAESLKRIELFYAPERRIRLTENEAVQFGCNVINVGKNVLMHASSDGSVARRLWRAGYQVTELPLGEFIKGGCAAKSLVLRLSDLSVTHR